MEDEIQPGTLGTETNAPASDTAASNEEQPTFQRVSADEAATLDFDTLKKRMREEARAYRDGDLPISGAELEPGDQGDDDSTAGSAENRRVENQRSGGQTTAPSATGQESELQTLLRQAQERTAALERESREYKQQQEQAELNRQHQLAEQRINSLPQQQQELARNAYRNSLHQAALNDYTGYLQQREGAVVQAEFTQAKRALPGQMREVADFVAQTHGIKPDSLYALVDSPQAKTLIEAANHPQGLISAATSLGQLLDWEATREAGQQAAKREQRRAGAPRQVRDTPAGGLNVAGGALDEASRINNMSREEFMAYKKNQLRQQRTA